MNLDNEIQLSDDLRHIVAGQSFQGDPDALLQRAQRARRRSVATRGMAGVGVLAVAATGAVIGLNAGGGAPQVQDVAYVSQHVAAVLNSDSDYVYRITDLDTGMVTYLDQVTMKLYFVSGSGNTRVEIWDSKVQVGDYLHVQETAVSYKDHTYSVSDDQVGARLSQPLAKEDSILDRIKQDISSGEEKIVGTGEYQGHQVIKLAFANSDSQFWVDSTTYQPVHSTSDGFASDLALLPRTADLAHTVNTPQVPSGFAKVADASDNIAHGG